MKITYTKATVIHSDKYNSNTGFYVAHFFSTNTMLDIVFKIDSTGDEYPVTIKGLNLLLYKGQSVSLISECPLLLCSPDTLNMHFSFQREVPLTL